MAPSRRTLSIGIALFISVVFMATGYFLSSHYVPSYVDAASAEALLKEYAKKDTDADGLPDWQEELYKTDPNNPHSFDPTLTDKEAVDQGKIQPRFASDASTDTSTNSTVDYAAPEAAKGSLTEAFGRALMNSYLNSLDAGGTDEERAAALQNAVLDDLASQSTSLFAASYDRIGATVDNTKNATSYVASIESILNTPAVTDPNQEPAPLIEEYVARGNTAAQPKIVTLGNEYARIAKTLSAVTVPSAYLDDHVALVRAFESLAKAMKAVANYDQDPLATALALQILIPAETDGFNAIVSMSNRFTAENGSVTGGGTGSFIARIASHASP